MTSSFDLLPNEIYLSIFDYLKPIDVLYSFFNINKRLNHLVRYNSPPSYLDLRNISIKAFEHYCLDLFPLFYSNIKSLKIDGEQFSHQKFQYPSNIKDLTLSLTGDYYPPSLLSDEKLFNGKCLLTTCSIENYAYHLSKRLSICPTLKQLTIHLKCHADLLEIMNRLPNIQKLHSTIDYDVSSTNESPSSITLTFPFQFLTDFSYIISQRHGLVYFVTNYCLIETLIKSFSTLKYLQMYIVGCLHTCLDGDYLKANLLKHLPLLQEFHFFFQSYGTTDYLMKDMSTYQTDYWLKEKRLNFGYVNNELTDIQCLFTLPYAFDRIDGCVNEHFIKNIKTNHTIKTNLSKCPGWLNVKHLELACDITPGLLSTLSEIFVNLRTVRCYGGYRYIHPSLLKLKTSTLKSVDKLIFEENCLRHTSLVQLTPNLHTLHLSLTILLQLIQEVGTGYLYQIKELHVRLFQQPYLQEVIDAFPNIRHLTLCSRLSDDELPLRSFVDKRCHHKHRPISALDIIEQLLSCKSLKQLTSVKIGCYWERDEENIQNILARKIHKYFGQYFSLRCEPYTSTACGNVLFSK
ncbi:unnamed protein product [Didymodactylos carnosus]|uniref:F-box domain-containing protein n=1 Tax=Didymodactylos carnosus TaxID=1234261 RepID=A0A813ZTT3_9BILA|nr:unnamed protein product [Didymodactylos carnosus]CAF0903429.1 unnamed protein product [Didymodactylos carnosus]CAF3538230.1 unnamed protein product [Didymodactylos carnosus]CAF3685622.1 unnamed protein product [Didymodactylos carnosus]